MSGFHIVFVLHTIWFSGPNLEVSKQVIFVDKNFAYETLKECEQMKESIPQTSNVMFECIPQVSLGSR